jgi:hypothetical protein
VALSTKLEAKSPDSVAPAEMVLPSLESVCAARQTPGLSGWLSRPDVTLKLTLTALLPGPSLSFKAPRCDDRASVQQRLQAVQALFRQAVVGVQIEG